MYSETYDDFDEEAAAALDEIERNSSNAKRRKTDLDVDRLSNSSVHAPNVTQGEMSEQAKEASEQSRVAQSCAEDLDALTKKGDCFRCGQPGHWCLGSHDTCFAQ